MTRNKVAHRKSETQKNWSELWIETESPSFTLTHPLTYIRLKINWVPVPPLLFTYQKTHWESHPLTLSIFWSCRKTWGSILQSFLSHHLLAAQGDPCDPDHQSHTWTRWVSNRCPMTQTMEPSKKLRPKFEAKGVISFGLDWCLRKMNIFGSFV